jgi:ATP-binding cassette subfamily G (WHITE) protein 2
MDTEDNQPMIVLQTDEKKQIHGSTISFNSINYTIHSTKCYNSFLASCIKKKQKQILYDLSGIFQPGMNAILGPTGSGKSTLLDILANRKHRQGLSGEVLIDGQTYTQDFNSQIGYVVQDDILSETLTVRENLMFSANLRLSRNISFKAKMNIVNLVISQLGLEKCADSKIGSKSNRRLSGGERRRTNIGMELVLSPTVLLLDEPTSGLDSSTANSVIECLSQLSQRGRRLLLLFNNI